VELTDSSVNLQNKPLWLDQMETVLEVLNEGVIIADENRRILFANSRFVEMTGLSREDLFQFDPLRFFSAQERDFLKRQVDVEFAAGHNRYTFALPSNGGGRVPVIVSSRTFQNLGSRFGVVTFTDITEQAQAEEELRAANAKLESRQQEIEEDLRLAARVQNSLTPSSFVSDSLRLDVFYHPVHSVGGDFALVRSQDREHISLLVCDVSGHGIGAALVANRIYSETTTHLRSGMPFPDMFEKLNRFLLEDIAGSSMYVTLAAARIDSRLLRMDYAGAGHPPVMLARHGQVPKLLESRSMILGALPEAVDPTPALHVELQPDDRIIFYTDGITEVFNSRGEMLGTSGLQEIVRQASSFRAEEMKQAILDGVSRWRNGPPTDDVSLMVVNVR
jgi:PAS domain S-box-containing protein